MTTQPLCEPCYLRAGGPAQLSTTHSRICCRCGAATTSGIYIRIDPATVPYPSED